ncbi:type II toxin-antitoxin system PemK/MazF family toxin [Deltaproteobacteria bacterium PRO3]|nr:type II toxin-antitoxin system PemK/MazF family toxin [Deltaproteobacteria bacterium PRO3]
MIDFKAGDFVLVPYPFTDPHALKHRPAFVVSKVQAKGMPTKAVIALVTSRVDEMNMPGDYRVLDWEVSGLKYPAMIRLSKIVTVEADILQKKLGSLSRREWKTVGDEFLKIFQNWIVP